MKTYHNELNWIWESKQFPKFIYNDVELDVLIYKFGQLKIVENFINQQDLNELQLEMLLNEAVSTSAIEGEILQRSSVRSSINRLFKLGLEDDYSYTVQSDYIAQILLDAKSNKEPLTKERLCSWHKALFPTGNSGLKDITIGEFRKDNEDMKIVSGAWEKEKIHYIAPPSKSIGILMNDFFKWLNDESVENGIYKAIVAHLYFVLIHPFDDGNGRLARAITDYLLAKMNLANSNFYSISTIIYKNRKEYYNILDIVCKQTNQDITLWIEWFVKLLELSIDETLQKIKAVQTKVKFWDKHKNRKLNDRQKKVILKMLSYLPLEFEGGMRVNKYISLTKSKRLTASRDISDLVQKDIFKSFGSGRTIYYKLILDSESKVELSNINDAIVEVFGSIDFTIKIKDKESLDSSIRNALLILVEENEITTKEQIKKALIFIKENFEEIKKKYNRRKMVIENWNMIKEYAKVVI